MTNDNTQPPFKNFTLGMFRQYFAELPDDTTFTAKGLWQMFEEAEPLLGEEEKKQLRDIIKKHE